MRGYLWALPAAVLAAAPVSADEPDPVEIMRAADQAVRKVETISFVASHEGVGALASRSPVVQGTVRAARIEGRDHLGWRFEAAGTRTGSGSGMTGEEADGGQAPEAEPTGSVEFRMSYDGKMLRSIRQAERTMIEAPPQSADEVLDDGAGWILGWLVRWDELVSGPFAEEGTPPLVAYEGTRLVGGVECHVVQVDYSMQTGMQEMDGWWFIGTEDSLPRRFDAHYYDNVGDGFGVVRLTDIKVGEPVDDAAFALAAPDGFEVAAFEPPAPKPAAAQAPEFPKLLAIGDAAPDWTLSDPTGKKHKLSEYRGKVVVLDFWGTWCPPCVMAMPGLQKLHEKYKDKPVAVLGLNVGDPPGAAEKHMKDKKFTYGLLLSAEPVAQDYGVSGFPTFFVIGTDGKVIHRAVGFNPKGEEEMAKIIDEHLARQLN